MERRQSRQQQKGDGGGGAADHASADRTSADKAALRDSSFEEGVEALAPADPGMAPPSTDTALELTQLALEPTVEEEVEGESEQEKKRPGLEDMPMPDATKQGGSTLRKTRAELAEEEAEAEREAWAALEDDDGELSLDVMVALANPIRAGVSKPEVSAAETHYLALAATTRSVWATALAAAQMAPPVGERAAPEATAPEATPEPESEPTPRGPDRRARTHQRLPRKGAALMQVRWERPAMEVHGLILRFEALAAAAKVAWEKLSEGDGARPRSRSRRRRGTRPTRTRNE